MSNESSLNQHEGVQCDVCGQSGFRGSRYKCLICPDFDMCSDCFQRDSSSGSHQTVHPMQCILSQTEIELYFHGEDLFICSQKLQSLTCPYCGLLGLTAKTLMKHLIFNHPPQDGGGGGGGGGGVAAAAQAVLCPLCAARSWRTCNYLTNDLAAHLVVEHHLAGPASLVSRIKESTVGTLRNPEAPPTRTPTPTPQRQLSTRANRTSMDAAFLELMSQLPDVRFEPRGPPGSGSGRGGSVSNSQALQQIQLINQQQMGNRPMRRGGFSMLVPPESLGQRESSGQPSPMGPLNNSRRASAGGRTRETALALHAALANESRRYCSNLNAHHSAANRGGNTTEPTDPATPANCVECKKIKSDNAAGNAAGGENQAKGEKFLLNKLLRTELNEAKLAKRDRERADRSLFGQALVLSAFAADFEEESPTQNEESTASVESSIHIDEKKPKKKKIKNTPKKSRVPVAVVAINGNGSSA